MYYRTPEYKTGNYGNCHLDKKLLKYYIITYMRIENTLTPNYWQSFVPVNYPNPLQQPQRQPVDGVILDISPETFAASRLGAAQLSQGMGVENSTECRTCESRTYQDVSDDPSVSFQTPTRISPGQSAAAVASHEAEHVSNEQAKADRDGREIVSQTVTLKTSICPECKRVYVSGGETRTLSKSAAEPAAEEPSTEQI